MFAGRHVPPHLSYFCRLVPLVLLASSLLAGGATAQPEPLERTPFSVSDGSSDPFASRLRKAGIEPNLEGISKFLESLLPSPEYQAQTATMIRQLASSNFRERQGATRTLSAMSNPPLAALQAAAVSADLEVQMRAKRILKQIQFGRHTSVLVAALHTIERQQIKGLSPLLLHLIPNWDTEAYLAPARRALASTCRVEDQEQLRRALRRDDFNLRLAAVVALASLLGANADQDLEQLLDDYDDRIRLAAARALADLGNTNCLSTLESLLESNDRVVVEASQQYLYALLGEQLSPVIPPPQAPDFPITRLKSLLGQNDTPIRYPVQNVLYAAWVWRQHGKIRNKSDDPTDWAEKLAELPWGSVRITGVDLSGSKITDAQIDQFTQLHDLTELNLANCSRLTQAGFGELGRLVSLRRLNLKDTDFSDTDAWRLKSLDLLQHLDLQGTTVSDASFTVIGRLPALTSLRIGRFVTDAGLFGLQASPRLESLHVHYNSHISDQGLEYLSKLPRLQQLALYRCTEITDQGVERLGQLSQLTELTLICPRVTDRGLYHLGQLTQLHRLDLYTTQVKGASLRKLSGLQNLECLNLARTQLDDEGILNMPPLPKLNELNMKFTQITDRGLEALKRLPALQRLVLINANISGEGLAHLHDLAKLEELDLHNASLDANQIAGIQDMQQLRVLDLGNTEVTDDSLAFLQGMDRLERLNLSRNLAISDAGLRHLTGLTQLKQLNVRQTRVTSAGQSMLQSLLPHVEFVKR